MTIQAVSAAFSINSKCAEKLTQLIQTSDPQSSGGVVRLGHQKVAIPPGLTKVIKCGVRTSSFPCQQEALFIPNESPSWLDTLEVGEKVINLQKGSWS